MEENNLDKLVCKNKDALLMDIDPLIYEDDYLDEDILENELNAIIDSIEEDLSDDCIVESIDFTNDSAEIPTNIENTEIKESIDKKETNEIRAPEITTSEINLFDDNAPSTVKLDETTLLDDVVEDNLITPKSNNEDDVIVMNNNNQDDVMSIIEDNIIEDDIEHVIENEKTNEKVNSTTDVIDNIDLITDNDANIDFNENKQAPIKMVIDNNYNSDVLDSISDEDIIKMDLNIKSMTKQIEELVSINNEIKSKNEKLNEDNVHFKNTILDMKNKDEFVEKNFLDKKISLLYVIMIVGFISLLFIAGSFLLKPNPSDYSYSDPIITEQISFNVAEQSLANYIALYLSGDITKDVCAYYIAQIPFESLYVMTDTVEDETIKLLFEQKEEAINTLIFSFQYDDINQLAIAYEDFVRIIEEINNEITVYFEEYLNKNNIPYEIDEHGNFII